MATLQANKPRKDGGVSQTVRWTQDGVRCNETFSAGTNAENLRRARAFLAAVEAAGNRWPQGWVKGHGYREGHDPTTGPTVFEYATRFVGELTEVAPRQRSDYLAKFELLSECEILDEDGHPYRPFGGPLSRVSEGDIRRWLAQFHYYRGDRKVSYSPKTLSNYHGLLYAMFSDAVYNGLIPRNPCQRTGISRKKIREAARVVIPLTEEQWTTFLALETDGVLKDVYTVVVGTGLRFSEVTALWVEDVDLGYEKLRVTKAWKRDGRDGEQDTPSWLAKRLTDKHDGVKGFHLSNPKSPKAKRTITLSKPVIEALERLVDGKERDDFVWTTPNGHAIHHANFTNRQWAKQTARASKAGLPHIHFHDLRHTHASWLINGGFPLPSIQYRLGHESIQTTVDTYGHLMTHNDDAMDRFIEQALGGRRLRLVQGALEATAT